MLKETQEEFKNKVEGIIEQIKISNNISQWKKCKNCKQYTKTILFNDLCLPCYELLQISYLREL